MRIKWYYPQQGTSFENIPRLWLRALESSSWVEIPGKFASVSSALLGFLYVLREPGFQNPRLPNEYSTCLWGCTVHTPLLTTSHVAECSVLLLQRECGPAAGLGWVSPTGLSSLFSDSHGWNCLGKEENTVLLDKNKIHSFNNEREWTESNWLGEGGWSNNYRRELKVWPWRLLAFRPKSDILNCVVGYAHTRARMIMFQHRYLCMDI